MLSWFNHVQLSATLRTGSSVHGILQARILEWVVMPSSRGSSWPRDRTGGSCASCIAGAFCTTEPPGKPWWAVALLRIARWLLPFQALCSHITEAGFFFFFLEFFSYHMEQSVLKEFPFCLIAQHLVSNPALTTPGFWGGQNGSYSLFPASYQWMQILSRKEEGMAVGWLPKCLPFGSLTKVCLMTSHFLDSCQQYYTSSRSCFDFVWINTQKWEWWIIC